MRAAIDQPHRLLSGMLAANGLVLFGLTTAVPIDLIRSLHAAQTGSAPDARSRPVAVFAVIAPLAQFEGTAVG